MKWLDPAHINRMSADPSRCTTELPVAAIDLSRPFVPEHYTQLYFTPMYRDLDRDHRLRYNQLFGVRINEYIMMLEADLVERLLRPLSRHPRLRGKRDLLAAIDTMIEEEKRHYAIFAALNRRCLPDVFVNGRDRYFSELPLAARATFRAVGGLARWLPFPLWYLMAMEESSTALAREMTATPQTETLGPLEPGFLGVHREHMKDEARHLHVDGHLIEMCMMPAGPRRRALNARLFGLMLHPITRVERRGSGVKVIRHLVTERPELKPLEERMIREVVQLTGSAEFQRSLFNRRAMPLTFGLFDSTPELAELGRHMVGYDRH